MAYDMYNGNSFTGKPAYSLRIYVRRDQTDNANNRSTYAWALEAFGPVTSTPSYFLDARTFGATAGSDFHPSHNLDFRGGVTKINIGSGTTGWFTHDANGYLNIATRCWANDLPVFGSVDSGTGWLYTDRIPKPPTAPGAPSFSAVDTTSVTVSWAASGNNNGAAIESYLLRRHTNPNPDASGYVDSVGNNLSRAVTGLTPGVTYYFKVYAANSQGFSPGSAVGSVTMKSGAYVGAGSAFPAGEILAGVGGSFQSAQVFYCDSASGPFVEAK